MGSAVESRLVAPERHGRTCSCPSPHLRQQPLACLTAQRGTLDTPSPPQPAALGTSCFSSPEIWSLPPLAMSSILPHTVPSWLGCHLGPRPCGVCLPHHCRGILSGHHTRSQPYSQPCRFCLPPTAPASSPDALLPPSAPGLQTLTVPCTREHKAPSGPVRPPCPPPPGLFPQTSSQPLPFFFRSTPK